jgi:hypothetical protein
MVANSSALRGLTEPVIACMEGLTGFFGCRYHDFERLSMIQFAC